MPERAFRAKFVKQRFRLIEGVGRHILGLEQVAKAALNLGFGKQFENLQAPITPALGSLGNHRANLKLTALPLSL